MGPAAMLLGHLSHSRAARQPSSNTVFAVVIFFSIDQVVPCPRHAGFFPAVLTTVHTWDEMIRHSLTAAAFQVRCAVKGRNQLVLHPLNTKGWK